MHFVNRKKLYHAALAVTFGIGCAQTARAVVPEYSILDLNTFGGTSSSANGLNNAGQVVGWAYASGSTARRAFVTSANSAINPATDMIPLLGGSVNVAYGIN